MTANPSVPRVADACIVVSLLLLSALLAAYYYIGPFGSDDIQYVQLAAGGAPSLGTGRFAVSGYYALMHQRLGMAGAIYSFFLYAFALAALTFLIARYFIGTAAAAAAALLVACNPLVFFYSAAILPDNPLGFFYFLHCGSFALFVWQGRRVAAAALSGAALAACYATKEASLLFALPTVVVGGYLMAYRWREVLPGALAFCIAFSVVVALDMVLSWHLFGDPLFRLTFTREHDVVGHAEQYMATQGVAPWTRTAYVIRQTSAYWPAPLLLFGLVASLGLPLLARLHKPELFAPSLYLSGTVLVVFGYLTWGTISLRHYVGVPLQPRYYLPLVPAAAIAAVVVARLALSKVCQPSWLPYPAVALLAIVAVWQITNPSRMAGRAYRSAEVMAFSRSVSVANLHRPRQRVVGDAYISGRYAAYGPETGVVTKSAAGSLRLRDFVFLNAASARDQGRELEALSKCASSVEPLANETELTIPADRKADLAAAFGVASAVRRESRPRVRAYQVHGYDVLCKW